MFNSTRLKSKPISIENSRLSRDHLLCSIGFDAALVGHMGPLSPPDLKPDLKPDISLLNGSGGGPFSPGNNCGPGSPGGGGGGFNSVVLQQQNALVVGGGLGNGTGQQNMLVGGGGGSQQQQGSNGGGGSGPNTPSNITQQYPPNHPLSGSKHLCSICGDRASGKHYGVYR
uniref:Nuclear receptor domain-containing protein n=1 Tax=Anopheles maculatus TaxID=74869 RepID=A0A182SR93_9DIPT